MFRADLWVGCASGDGADGHDDDDANNEGESKCGEKAAKKSMLLRLKVEGFGA